MKKSKLVLVVGMLMLVMGSFSCKKTYQCHCLLSDGTKEVHEVEGEYTEDELVDKCLDVCN
jgi:hypothetical protein